jgi:hypothetical protein
MTPPATARTITERAVPNYRQIDATEVRLADYSKAWVVDVVDDPARVAIAAHACWIRILAVISIALHPQRMNQPLGRCGINVSRHRAGVGMSTKREATQTGRGPTLSLPKRHRLASPFPLTTPPPVGTAVRTSNGLA